MIAISSIDSFARRLETSAPDLWRLLRRAERHYREFMLLDPARPDKQRIVIDATEPLKGIQRRLFKNVLLLSLGRSRFSHGGIQGCSILSNARPHRTADFFFKTDISNFYPSIHRIRVLRLFLQLGCVPEVAEACTRLCTFQHHLAQGLVTSPILADYLLRPIDERIGKMCEQNGLVYTRYVDDLTISGPFSIGASKFPAVVREIIEAHGFEYSEEKTLSGRRSDGIAITGVDLRNGRPDVTPSYFNELVRQLHDAGRLARGEEFEGPFFTQTQIWGRVQFVCWVNPKRKQSLVPLMAKVDWKSHERFATDRRLIALRKRLVAQSR